MYIIYTYTITVELISATDTVIYKAYFDAYMKVTEIAL